MEKEATTNTNKLQDFVQEPGREGGGGEKERQEGIGDAARDGDLLGSGDHSDANGAQTQINTINIQEKQAHETEERNGLVQFGFLMDGFCIHVSIATVSEMRGNILFDSCLWTGGGDRNAAFGW